MAECGSEQPCKLEARRPLPGHVKHVRPGRAADQRDDRTCEIGEPGWRVERIDEAFHRTALTELAREELQERGLVVVERADPHAGEPSGRGQPSGDLGTQLRMTVGGRRCDRRRFPVAAARTVEHVVGGDVEHRHVGPGAQHVGRGAHVRVVGDQRSGLAFGDVLVAGGMNDRARRQRSREVVDRSLVEQIAADTGSPLPAHRNDRHVLRQAGGEPRADVAVGARYQNAVTHARHASRTPVVRRGRLCKRCSVEAGVRSSKKQA